MENESRVNELLAKNNEYLERARAAERQVQSYKRFIDTSILRIFSEEERYRHVKTEAVYTKVFEALLKTEDGVWEPAVVYVNDSGARFVRSAKGFDQSFERVI